MSRSIGNAMLVLWLAVIAIGTQGSGVMAQSPVSIQESLERAAPPTAEEARTLMAAGQFDEAAETWRSVAQADPENATAWFLLGYCLHAAGRLDEAIEVHKQAATFDEYHGIALYNLGCAYALTGRTDAAIETLAECQAAGFQLRGRAEDDSDFDSIRHDPRFTALLKREPAGWRGRLQQALGAVQGFVQERAPQAKRTFAGLLQQAAAGSRGLLAALHEKLATDERFAGIAQKLQQWMGARGGPDGADGSAITSESSATPSLEALLRDAQRHQQAGNWEAAAAACVAATELEPQNATAWFGLAYSHHMNKDYEKAIEANKKAATFEQNRATSLYNLACAYALTGQTDNAIEALVASKEAGLDIAQAAASDSDLDSLRKDHRFIMLVTGGTL